MAASTEIPNRVAAGGTDCPAAKRRRGRGGRRQHCPQSSHAELGFAADGRDIVAMIEASREDRLANLIPVRYSRMLESPFRTGKKRPPASAPLRPQHPARPNRDQRIAGRDDDRLRFCGGVVGSR
jgi:hypothetical protein